QDGHTILISTPDLASISTFCDRTILINHTILAEGPTAEVFTEENLVMTFGGLPTLKTMNHSQTFSLPRHTFPHPITEALA
ncbi:MAG: hypothetical protein ACO3NK_20520, partial [Prochlorotrichaceae cyanobacterium]